MSKDFRASKDKILYQDVRQSGRFFGALPPKSRVEKWGNTDRTWRDAFETLENKDRRAHEVATVAPFRRSGLWSP